MPRFLLKNLILITLLLMPFFSFAQEMEKSYNIASYNIKYDNPKDTANAWPVRKSKIASMMLFNEVDILGIQEGLRHQVYELDSLLPNHKYIGVGRDDGAEKGEYTAVFYNMNLFEVLDSGTFWLSPTPETPSKGWDAAFPRICTWAALKVKKSNDILFVFNTHFDHQGKTARLNSAKLILDQIKTIAENNPVVLLGDFNIEPQSAPYALLTKDFSDAFSITQTPHFGPNASYNNFDFHKIPQRRIDYIFVNKFFDVLRHGILNNHYNMKYPSDHFPVIAEIKFSID